ncbi:MAG TPA: hypothetical protein VL098_03020 [Flavipsychrobacter sp.]|nr:hypothetical protein [Flavipsychrobacter sp.]
MKKFLFIAAISTLVFSCAKKEDLNPRFRPVTCDDATDDGIFEAYSEPEEVIFLKDYASIPSAPAANVLSYLHITANKLYNNSVGYDPVIRYKPNVATNLIVYLPTEGHNTYYSWEVNSSGVDDTLSVPIYNARKLNLPSGCHRLYYVFADKPMGTILTKGHFDFEVVPY